jgi:hypothetical protein
MSSNMRAGLLAGAPFLGGALVGLVGDLILPRAGDRIQVACAAIGGALAPGRSRDIGDVRHPKLVGPLGSKVTVHKVRCGPCLRITTCRHRATLAMAGADQARFTHQACDPLAPMSGPFHA